MIKSAEVREFLKPDGYIYFGDANIDDWCAELRSGHLWSTGKQIVTWSDFILDTSNNSRWILDDTLLLAQPVMRLLELLLPATPRTASKPFQKINNPKKTPYSLSLSVGTCTLHPTA